MLSIVICSRDRAGPLARCLRAVPADAMRAEGAELVVVDNGSRDETAGVIASFAATARFAVRAVHEAVPGLSRARNAGLRAASGDVIAFTDDDCILSVEFPAVAAHVFDDGEIRWCGGRILLGNPSDARYCILEGTTARAFPAGAVVLPGEIQGSNMVVHRDVVNRIGGFDTMLGAGTPFRSEDIDYLARASLAGLPGAFVPELVVTHHHGRRPGPELRALMAANDVARGAFFAKLADLGSRPYALAWRRSLLRPWRPASSWRAWRGAREYRRAIRERGERPALRVPLGDSVAA